MNGKLEFVDTNLLIYAYDLASGQKHDIAKQLIKRLWLEQTGAISVQVMQEFLVNITKKIAQPLSWSDAIETLEELQHWKVHSPSPQNVLNAAQSVFKNRISFWDAMILESASTLECHTLWSEDLNHGQKMGEITIKNPFEENP